MNKWFSYCFTGVLALSAVTPTFSGASEADQTQALQQQVDELNKRVDELERRLQVLESPEIKALIADVVPAQNPGDRDDQDNWNRLKAGLDYNEVRELLGEPEKIKKGSTEYWYYSDAGLKGPFVKFLFRKVQSWKEPGDK